MHELSIIANLFEILEEKGKEKKAKKITLVRLQVGMLSGVVPEFLKTAFDIYKKDTFVAEAKLEITQIPLKIKCKKCHSEMVKDDFVFICDKCNSRELKILTGTELILEKLELEV